MSMSYIGRTPTSKALYERARKTIPGGATYSVRYFEPYPVYISRARGSRVWDVDGNEYIDFWMAHFAALLGHGYPAVVEAVKEQLELGAHVGYCNEWEVKWSESVCRWFGADRVKPANSGTESNMYAVRLARAFTGKKLVAKAEGGWHGGSNGLHKAVNYPYEKPAAAGLPRTQDTLAIPFNDIEGSSKALRRDDVACVLVEPVLSAAGEIPADREYLKGLREICDERGALLIFDEVVTGFRHPGGLQAFYGVKPDLTTLGKTVGGQYFAGAGGFCGRADVMDMLDQTKVKSFWERPFLGGTYTGNPLNMRAGYVVISELERRKDEVFPHLDTLGELIRRRLVEAIEERKVQAYVTGIMSVFGIHFTKERPVSGATAERTKLLDAHRALHRHMLEGGILYLTPASPHLALSAAHTQEDVEKFVSVFAAFLDGFGSSGDR